MKIAFVTTQTLEGSSVAGRVLPLAEELSKQHEVHIVGHGQGKGSNWHSAGEDPFTRTASGKVRLTGLNLIVRMLKNIWETTQTIKNLNPDVVIIVKPLPENVAAVWVSKLFISPKKIILDVDDFELTANVLSSLFQRAAIHASERLGASIATTIVTASPFLSDHMKQLVQQKKPVVLIPTGAIGTQENFVSEKGPNPTVTFIGSFSISSGHRVDLLPEIMAKVSQSIPNVVLKMIGSGDDRQKLEKEFERNKVSVIWGERFTAHEVAALLRDTSVVIDPVDTSITNRAKSSYRVMLALAFGLPVVTSNVGIRSMLLPSSLHDRSFAIPGDAQDYAQKVISFLQQELTLQEKEAMRTQGQKYSWNSLAKQYEQVII